MEQCSEDIWGSWWIQGLGPGPGPKNKRRPWARVRSLRQFWGPGPGPWKQYPEMAVPFTCKSEYLLVNILGVFFVFGFGMNLESYKSPYLRLFGANLSIAYREAIQTFRV